MSHVRRMQPWLGTLVEVGVSAGPAAERAIDAAFAAVAQVHRLLSFQDLDSDLSRLNRACARPVALDPLSVRALCLARGLMRATDGLFNCTVAGALERLGALPAPDGIAVLEHGDADDIEILDRRTARLRRPVHVTLDGIAKGIAVDRAACALKAHGAQSAWVNAGGDLRVYGAARLPLALRGTDGIRVIGRIGNGAAATSVTSSHSDERFPGRIVSTSDMPPRAGAWTVIAREAWRADALTKIAALLPGAVGAAAIERLGGRLIAVGGVAP